MNLGTLFTNLLGVLAPAIGGTLALVGGVIGTVFNALGFLGGVLSGITI